MSSVPRVSADALDRWRRCSFLVGGAALVISIIAGCFQPAVFFRAYFYAYVYLLGFSLGGMVLVMIYHLTGGAWGYLLRRFAEAQMKTIPIWSLAFIPVLIWLGCVYPWVESETPVAGTPGGLWEHYLTRWFFTLRAVLYFTVWSICAFALSGWSADQDRKGYLLAEWKASNFSGPGLFLFGVTFHFATLDWFISLQTGFASSILAPMVFSGYLLSSYSLAVVCFCIFIVRREFANVLSVKVMYDLGSLLFTFLVLWAYMIWFQFMLTWMANLPRGVRFYVPRSEHGWDWLVWYLFAFHFVLPFFCLLLRTVKQNRRLLGSIAAWTILGQALFVYYQVMPVLSEPGIIVHLLNLLVLVGLGGLWLGLFLWSLRRAPLLPIHDVCSADAAHLHELDRKEHEREEAILHG